jgi:hypothetical protein
MDQALALGLTRLHGRKTGVFVGLAVDAASPWAARFMGEVSQQ